MFVKKSCSANSLLNIQIQMCCSIADRLIRIRVHSLWGISMYLQKKETILIVDDSKFQRAIIREMLGEHFHLEEATSGEECLMILEKSSHLIDLVLLDLVMPGIDGFGSLTVEYLKKLSQVA